MVGMITSVLVKTAPEREDSETRTVSTHDLYIILIISKVLTNVISRHDDVSDML